ncbi:MAG TPA: hypothetical protein DEZ08_06920 [Dehalococcoidia bacterium]|nr:hypothetical protein [Dehalococcoidia bacterium]
MKPIYVIRIFVLCLIVKCITQLNKIPLFNKLITIKLVHVPYSSHVQVQVLPRDKLEIHFTYFPLKLPIMFFFHGFIYFFRSSQHQTILNDVQKLINDGSIPQIDKNSRILEVGCNTGAIIRKLQKKYPAQYSGIDIDRNSISFAQRCFKNPAICFLQKDVLSNDAFKDYPNNFFTHIFSFSHMVHIPFGDSRNTYLKELQRIGQSITLKERIYPPRNNRFVDDFHSLSFKLSYASEKANSRIQVGLIYFNKEEEDLFGIDTHRPKI